jgi:hypothetical protein
MKCNHEAHEEKLKIKEFRSQKKWFARLPVAPVRRQQIQP